MKIIVEKKEILKAVEKASVRSKDFIFSVTGHKTGEGKIFSTVTSSDGNTQSTPSFLIKEGEVCSFVVGPEIMGVLKAVGQFGDEYTIEVSDSTVTISAGSATIPIPRKNDGLRIKIKSPKNNKHGLASFERESFVKAIRQGSFAFASNTANQALAMTVALKPENDTMSFLSATGSLAARAKVSAKEINDEYKNLHNTFISLDAPALRAISSNWETEIIYVMIFDTQVTFKDGNDVYTIIRYETNFPAQVENILNITAFNYTAEFNVVGLKAALNVATILEGNDNKKACIVIDNGKVTISSPQGNHKALVDAEGVDGEIAITINAKDVERALTELGTEKVKLFGEGLKRPVFITAENVTTFTAPCIDKD